MDARIGVEYLIDTGANVSVVPWCLEGKNLEVGAPKLYTANGQQISTYGTKLISLNLGLRREFSWRFIIADVSRPIIGADFLHFFNLIVDLRHKRLLVGNTLLYKTTTVSRNIDVPTVTTIDFNNEFKVLLTEFKDVTNPSARKNVQYSCTPPTSRKAEVGSSRIRADDKRKHLPPIKEPMSQLSPHDKYSVVRIYDVVHQFNRCQVFSVLDLHRTYHQVPMAEPDISKTAVITPFGLYEFLVMPFGLCNAAQTFQRLMYSILKGLDFCYCYVDDIIVASPHMKSQQKHLRIVLKKLSENGRVPRLSSYRYWDNPNTGKDSLQQYSKPQTIMELRRFLGILGFYRRFLPKAKRSRQSTVAVRLPGEFFTNTEDSIDTHHFLNKFREHIRHIKSQPIAHHSKHRIFVHKTLHICTHVFVRTVSTKKPLEPPYEEPFEII
ncbi:uncharacterized protein LOC143422379 [Xylocopa sonorina]|uniref:uncharacterized protein LOC143422379 n=1 Tax=Xylocopa sonorina TaxID=1818115 RepID=UPI00403AC2AC